MKTDNTKQNSEISPLDYDQMRELGLSYIREYASKNWSDYSLHDPGVTFLEAMCFSLADLGYRTNFAIKDLLTKEGEHSPTLDGSLYQAKDILSYNPISVDEYKKSILEIEYESESPKEDCSVVRNVWIEKIGDFLIDNHAYDANRELPESISPQGFYKVILQCPPDVDKKSIESKVSNFLNEHRNLCEVFKTYEFLRPADIAICLEMELEDYVVEDKDVKEIVGNLYKEINAYVSPTLHRYTADELMSKGKSLEDIYQGIVPESGRFVDMEEMKKFDSPKMLYISDVIAVIKKIEGIRDVKHFHFIDCCEREGVIDALSDYRVRITENTKDSKNEEPGFYFNLLPFNDDRNRIFIHQNGLSINLPSSFGIVATTQYSEEDSCGETGSSIESKNRHVDHYFSFQNILPQCYNLKRKTLPYLNLKSKGQALQLKAYLAFFDQILSDYLVRLGSLDKLFSIDENKNSDKGILFDTSWLYGKLSDDEIDSISSVLRDNEDFKTEFNSQNNRLRLKIINHLLSRFNERFPDYALLKDEVFQKNDCIRFNWIEDFEDKKRLLGKYPELSANRTQAINLGKKQWSACSGVESMILAKLGINSPNVVLAKPVYAKDYDYERTFGLHILEHILFLPQSIDRNTFLELSVSEDSNEIVEDPYSFHVTVVLPGWLSFSQNLDFRKYVEKIIHEEMPAHVLTKICWISFDAMSRVESLLRITDKENVSNKGSLSSYFSDENVIREVKSLFADLYNVYPSSPLKDESEFDLNPLRLDFVRLGDEDIEIPILKEELYHSMKEEHHYSMGCCLESFLQGVLDSIDRKGNQDKSDASRSRKRRSVKSQKKTENGGNNFEIADER